MGKLLDNKVAIVTGGGSGIGLSAALLFAREGAKVVIANRRTEEGEAAAQAVLDIGGTAIFIRTDICKATQVENLVSKTISHYKKLDCSFNCAGLDGVRATILESDEQHWVEILNTNLIGTYLLVKYEAAAMTNFGSGSIVNMSSVYGFYGKPGRSAYNASRAAIMNFTKTAALEFIKSKIRINAVAPAATRTELFDRMTSANPDAIAKYAALHPIGRIAEPEEVAEAALWLLSEKSSFVVGQTLVVDGGISAGFHN